MFVHATYWMWTRGQFRVSHTIPLDRDRRYLVTGALAGRSGGDYGQVFIATVCTMVSDDQVVCGVRDDPGDPPADNITRLGIVETLTGAVQVTLKLRGDDGLHRAEGVVYDLTESPSLPRGLTMAMASYAVYDRDTGEVVHVHAEPAGLATPPGEVLQLVGPGRGRALGVVRMPREGLAATALRVVDGELSPADEGVGFGGAGGGDGSGGPAVARRYEPRRPGGDPST
jgi:hypothetical protein